MAGNETGFIGEGVLFKGSISAPNTLVVNGIVEGDVTARSVLVGAGAINGSVKAIEADIHGRIKDNVVVEEFLHLSPTSQVEGTVTCRDIQIDRGACLKASFSSIGEAANDNPLAASVPAEAPVLTPIGLSPGVGKLNGAPPPATLTAAE
jgi:cytoskeletal protein CcmA (bactofilin family)